jgi:threonine dehydrogenase-like Zn-dependent dehydrogenase
MRKALLSTLAVMVFTMFGAAGVVAQEAAAEKPEAAKPAVKAETISGTLSMVVTDKKLVVLTGTGGVPYNFKVTGSTRIKVGGKKVKLDELAGQTNKLATVKFLSLPSGNIAQSIEVGP